MSDTKWRYKHKHVSTILPSFFRKVETCFFVRERFSTPDGDFFDVDKLENNNKNLVILLPGLEGSAKEQYIQSHAQMFFKENYDVFAMNYRSCSGEMNKTTKMYHSGETGDLKLLIDNVINTKKYQAVSLIGFSLGANVILKFLGEESLNLNKKINCAVCISVPMDLKGCSYKLAKGFNRIYSLYFMLSLRKKVKHIQRVHKHEGIKNVNTRKLKTFLEFDDLVTAPLYGFKSGEDYWEKSSSRQYLSQIKIPTKIINAKNDPFLSEDCFPYPVDINNDYLDFDYPKLGGHLGFVQDKLNNRSYAEQQCLKFVNKNS